MAQVEHAHDHEIPANLFDSHEISGLDSIYFSMEVLTVFWVFALAASVGSFLNVVIYRLPLKMNLSHPKSHCPQCKTEISAWDNIPILGWLKLGGKCRNCKCRISARYPLVEASVGIIVIAIFTGELLRGCSNLPFHSYAHHTHSYMSEIVWEMRFDLILISFMHAYLVVMLLVFAIISMDEMEVPSTLIRRSILLIAVVGLILPDVYPVAFHVPFEFEAHLLQLSDEDNSWSHNYKNDYHDPHWNIVGESIINLFAGLLVAYLLTMIWKFRDQSAWSIPKLQGLESMMLLTGAFLGWQAVLFIFIVYQLVRYAIETLGWFKNKIPTWMTHQLGLMLLTLLFILNWKTCGYLGSIW